MSAPDVVHAASDADAVEAFRAARAAGRRVRIVGGGVSAVPARDGAVTLSARDLRGIVSLRPDDGVVTVRAGTSLAELDAELRAAGCRLPIRPWDGDGRGTVGGAVAAAADGLTAREGFRWRDVVLGAALALATGEVVRTGASVVKSVAGYDVPRMVPGSRGTIGFILFLDIRIERIPESSVGCSAEVLAPVDVARLVASVDAAPTAPRGLVVTPAGDGAGAVVDVLFEGPARAVAAAARAPGFRAVEEPRRRWDGHLRGASAPTPAGLARRVGRCPRGGAAARFGATRSGAGAGGWIEDVLRGRCAWVEIAPSVPAPRDPASVRLIERVRAAFDPDGLLQPGRGFGEP